MALKFAGAPGSASFAPGAGPTLFEQLNDTVLSMWTGEVALVATGLLAALTLFVFLQSHLRGAGERRPRRREAEIFRADPVSMTELRHARMPIADRPRA